MFIIIIFKSKKIINASLLLLLSTSYAEESPLCINQQNFVLPKIESSQINDFKTSIFPKTKDLEDITDLIVSENFKKVPPLQGETRYELNTRLNALPLLSEKARKGKFCTYEGQENIYISMEGTGAFEPRLAPIMQNLTHKLRTSGLDISDKRFQPYSYSAEALERKTNISSAWSGLCRGILSTTLRDNELSSTFRSFHFPSEEAEVLATRDSYKNLSPEKLIENISNSRNNRPQGIIDAENCIKDIFSQAQEQGKKPKLIVTAHSSGARAAVKLLEKLKSDYNPLTQKMGIKVDLLFTVDPVKEAHEAMIEGIKEVINKGTEHNRNKVVGFFGVEPKKVYPPKVDSINQPDRLYKPGNSLRHLNFYQREDTEGLKIEPTFGIHGSPIADADVNVRIGVSDGIGTAGHGEIAYNPKVMEAFIEEIKKLRTP